MMPVNKLLLAGADAQPGDVVDVVMERDEEERTVEAPPLLKKALAKNANDRYPTCLEFVDALAGALQASPAWHPLPRSSAQSMPTFAGPAVEFAGAPRPAAGKPIAEAVAPRIEQAAILPAETFRMRAEQAEPRNPLLKTLVWLLVAFGLIGLVLFGAQKYLFNRNAETSPATVAEVTSEMVGRYFAPIEPGLARHQRAPGMTEEPRREASSR